MNANPKTHDSLFKWLISAFTREFFAHYFPAIQVGAYTFIDKEFISKYEALKESLEGDLFLAMEVEIDGEFRDVIIQIEHAGQRKDLSRRVFRYLCYAWLLKEKPVWSIVIYTDEAVWKKPVTDSFWYAFDSRDEKQLYHFDVIKLKWVDAYKKVPAQTVDQIRQETNMTFIATTITEHIRHEAELEGILKGKAEGKAEGRIEGKIEGKIEGEIDLLDKLYRQGIVSQQQYDEMIGPLRRKQLDIGLNSNKSS